MSENNFLPIFALETETGDMKLFVGLEEFRSMVEEFWDILQDDFKFWDNEGYPLKVEKSFLNKNGTGIARAHSCEYKVLRSNLIKHAQKNGVKLKHLENLELIEIFHLVEKRDKISDR